MAIFRNTRTAAGSYMMADKLLTIFTPSDYLHTIRNTDASIPDYRLIEKTRTAADHRDTCWLIHGG